MELSVKTQEADGGLAVEAEAEYEAALERRLTFQYRYTRLDLIGSGAQGQVFRVRDNYTNEILAAKRIPVLSGWNEVDRLQNETRALENLNHPSIPKYRGFYVQEDSQWGIPDYILVIDYAEGESLSQKLEKGKRYTEKELQDIKAQVLDALYEAHNKGIVHRDIKPANIIIDENGNVKVTDFGIAKFLGERAKTKTLCAGSAFYWAPEQAKGEKIVPETDYYGLAMTLLALASGREADYEMEQNPRAQLEKLHLSKSFRKSLELMLSEDPAKRKEGLQEKVANSKRKSLIQNPLFFTGAITLGLANLALWSWLMVGPSMLRRVEQQDYSEGHHVRDNPPVQLPIEKIIRENICTVDRIGNRICYTRTLLQK